MLGKLAIFLALTCALGIGMATGTEQKITMYNTPNCKGGMNVTYTSTEFIWDSWERNAASHYTFGVWKALLNNGTEYVQITSTSTSRNGTCYNKEEILRGLGYNASQFRFTFVERVGPGNLTTIQLNFYDQQDFQGSRSILTNGMNSTNVRVQSYAHFGNASWILYPNSGYSGRPVCLEHEENLPSGALTYNLETSIQVGSVKMNPSGNCIGYPRVKAMQENSIFVQET